MTDKKLSHVDASGKAAMVDVSQKPETERLARAMARVIMQPATLTAIIDNKIKKGDVFTVAKLAGIQGAKKTSDLIPLCHPLALSHISVDMAVDENPDITAVVITATAKTTGKTGVEMEALTAAAVAGLTLYDMVKAIDKSAIITDIKLLEKSGGKSGVFKLPTT
ncbi:MAG: cyclic pyranopterin monophosphate synthase MoaC [Hydrotalea sp.]|nr:cyclic pyranopterin monophosphate synthase MoaC [Hydrotalea sp.]